MIKCHYDGDKLMWIFDKRNRISFLSDDYREMWFWIIEAVTSMRERHKKIYNDRRPARVIFFIFIMPNVYLRHRWLKPCRDYAIQLLPLMNISFHQNKACRVYAKFEKTIGTSCHKGSIDYYSRKKKLLRKYWQSCEIKLSRSVNLILSNYQRVRI